MQATEKNQSDKHFLNQFDSFHLATPEQPSSIQPQVSDTGSDSYFGGNSDCSLEFAILEFAISPEKKAVYQAEKTIVEYMKTLGLKMKTDPRAKQDRFYANVKKRQQKKAQTQIFIKPVEKKQELADRIQFSTPKYNPKRIVNAQIQLNSNTILQRRIQQTPTSSPLIEKIKKKTKKSQFCLDKKSGLKIKKNQSFSSSSQGSNGSLLMLGT